MLTLRVHTHQQKEGDDSHPLCPLLWLVTWPSVQVGHLVMSDSAIPWTAAHQTSLSITSSRSLLKLMSIESLMPSNSLILWGWDSQNLRQDSPALNLSQYQGLFQWVSSFHQVAKVLEFQLQHQSFEWTPRTDLLHNGLVGSPCSSRDSQESSLSPQFKSINLGAQLSLWFNSHIHSFD